MNANKLAIGFAAAAFVGLLMLSAPVAAANIVILKCENGATIKIDYDHSTVTDRSGITPATITAGTITWSEDINDGDFVDKTLDRDTGLLVYRFRGTHNFPTSTIQCTVQHSERF